MLTKKICFIDVITFAAHCQPDFHCKWTVIKLILLQENIRVLASFKTEFKLQNLSKKTNLYVQWSFLFFCGSTAVMSSWFLFRGIKELPCFMSSVTLTEDKGEMVVIRNKVPVTFEETFDIHPLSVSHLSSFAPTTSIPLYLSLCLISLTLSNLRLYFFSITSFKFSVTFLRPQFPSASVYVLILLFCLPLLLIPSG